MGEKIDSQRGIPNLNHIAGCGEILLFKSKGAESEVIHGSKQSIGIIGVRYDKEIKSAGVPGYAVVSQGISSDDQIVNVVRVE